TRNETLRTGRSGTGGNTERVSGTAANRATISLTQATPRSRKQRHAHLISQACYKNSQLVARSSGLKTKLSTFLQRRQRPLQPHAPRGLQQHHIACAQMLAHPFPCSLGRLHK